jgi:hypothetical protein
LKRSEFETVSAPAGRGNAVVHKEAGAGYAVRYADPGYAQLGRIVEREKRCPTENTALRFCLLLRQLGGKPLELLQLIPGRTAAVLAGRELEEAVDRLKAV